MSIKKPIFDAFTALAARHWGGKQDVLPIAGLSGIVTQSFNVHHRPADTALLFLPGFASIPTKANPGILKTAAREQGWDFVRFYHPNMLQAPDKLTYNRMLAEAAMVAVSMPQQKIVLAGSSFGAGMMPYVADMVNEEQPGKVVGLMGWNPVPPSALMRLFGRQPGIHEFLKQPEAVLKVESDTMDRPFFMNHKQFGSVTDMLGAPLMQSFNGHVHFITGLKDSVSKPEDALEIIKLLQPATSSRELLMDAGHKVPPEEIRAGVREIAQRLRLG